MLSAIFGFIGELLMIVIAALLLGTAAAPAAPIRMSVDPIYPPPDACFSGAYTCAATVAFTVLANGAVSEVSINESSRHRPCDRAILQGVSGWRYAPQEAAMQLSERVVAYTCPASRNLTDH